MGSEYVIKTKINKNNQTIKCKADQQNYCQRLCGLKCSCLILSAYNHQNHVAVTMIASRLKTTLVFLPAVEHLMNSAIMQIRTLLLLLLLKNSLINVTLTN